MIVGIFFDKIPSKNEIEENGVLGYKYLDNKTDLINSAMRTSQKENDSVFYTGVKYDLITIKREVFKGKEFRLIANITRKDSYALLLHTYEILSPKSN